jgi:hypothetical protein
MSDHRAITVTTFLKDGEQRYRVDCNGCGYSGWREFHPDDSAIGDLGLLKVMLQHIVKERMERYGE